VKRRCLAPANAAALLTILAVVGGCASPAPVVHEAATTDAPHLIGRVENRIVETLIDHALDEVAALDGEFASRLGRPSTAAPWSGEATAEAGAEILERYAALIEQGVNTAQLSTANNAEAQLLLHGAQLAKQGRRFRDYYALINQIDGPQVTLPLFLITMQPAETEADFNSYITRIRGMLPAMQGAIDRAEIARSAGLVPTADAHAGVADQCRALTANVPRRSSPGANPVWDDFYSRIGASDLDPAVREILLSQARDALRTSMIPACEALTTYLRQLPTRPAEGIWATPSGEDFYQHELHRFTRTDWAAADVARVITEEWTRIHRALEQILVTTGTSLDDLRPSAGATPMTESGTHTVLDRAGDFAFRAEIEDLTSISPANDLLILKRPDFLASSGTDGSYLPGSPGVFLLDTDVPADQMETLTAELTLPGQHLVPISPLQNLIPLPAFIEGWGLYSVDLLTSPGHYVTPAARLGKLVVEATRIARARADIGLHLERWSRAEAAAFLYQALPLNTNRVEEVVSRLMVRPGEATAAVTGAYTIRTLRDEAATTLGDRFVLQEFHDVLLSPGPAPLPWVESHLRAWVAEKSTGTVATKGKESEATDAPDP
jgi:uncharacterized protein (DUF885 family)